MASAARALMEIGIFEAIPARGSTGITELAERCEADEALIGTPPTYEPRMWLRLTMDSPADETAHLRWYLHRTQAGSVGT